MHAYSSSLVSGSSGQVSCTVHGTGVGLGVVERERVLDGVEVDTFERLGDACARAHRVADGVHARVAVDVHGLDHQRVAVPSPDRFSKPRGRQILGEGAAVGGDDVEHRVLLEQHHQVIVVVDDLQGMRAVDRSRHAEGQAVADVVAVGLHELVVAVPLGLAPGGVGQLLDEARDGLVGHVRAAGVVPHAGHARLAVSQARRRTGRCRLAPGRGTRGLARLRAPMPGAKSSRPSAPATTAALIGHPPRIRRTPGVRREA